MVFNDWMLARRERRPQEAEATGTRDDVERMAAYRAQAERSFYRALNALNQVRKDYMRDRREEFKLERQRDRFLYENERLKTKLGIQEDAPKTEAKEITPAQKAVCRAVVRREKDCET